MFFNPSWVLIIHWLFIIINYLFIYTPLLKHQMFYQAYYFWVNYMYHCGFPGTGLLGNRCVKLLQIDYVPIPKINSKIPIMLVKVILNPTVAFSFLTKFRYLSNTRIWISLGFYTTFYTGLLICIFMSEYFLIYMFLCP